MADGPSNETIRQMLTGFNGMQAALGLLPPATGGPSVGLGPAVVVAPPPPPVPHPSVAAVAAIQQQQAMMQQTMAAAQMTRYAPPPSAPTPSSGMGFGWGGAMGQMASQQLNPFAAAGLSGSGFGMPSPSMMTSPAFGMFRPGGAMAGGGGIARVPSIFNPLAPTMPSPHFSTPAMHSLQLMQARHAQGAGALAGAGEFGLGVGGSVIGGALGSAFGPLGTMAGSWLGGKLGGLVGNMALGPASHDMAQGRMIQRMTAPFMVSGANLDPSGQGMSVTGSRQVATGIRHLTRDHDFERTGFNAADATRIMGLSAQQGLLTGSQTPDEIVRRVKDISKSVKVLMQITGDPDVRDAIASLGQMRNLGFQGLSAQMGAVANRASFARMAGVSQAAAHEMYGMPGAMMAQQVGLSGSTGYAAGLAGGGLANIAASSGALNDLQLARAGGRSGLAQINTMAQVSAMQSDIHLMASLRRGSKGLEVDMDAFRKSQSMTPGEVAREAAERANRLGSEGLFEWRTRRQEFKDQIAQKLTPLEMNLNVVRQAEAMRRAVPGMNLGAAIYSTVQSNAVGSGMSEEQAEQTARALELQFTNRNYWEGQKSQLRGMRRQAVDQQRARFAEFETPGLLTRMGRGVRGLLGGMSDVMSGPLRRVEDHFRRVGEDEEAAGYGEHIRRVDDISIAHDDAERRMMLSSDPRFLRRYQSGTGSGLGSASMGNLIGSGFGLTSTSGANRVVRLANESYESALGLHPLGAFGNASSSLARVRDVAGAGNLVRQSDNLKAGARVAMVSRLDASTGGAGQATLQKATSNLIDKIESYTAGTINSATALSLSDVRQAYIESHPDKTKAAAEFDSDPRIGAAMVKTVMSSGTDKQKEVLGRSVEIGTKFGAVDMTRSREGLHQAIRDDLSAIGFGDLSDKSLSEAKSIFAHHSKEEVAVAAAVAAATSSNKTLRQQGESQLTELRKQMGDKKFGEIRAGVEDSVLKGAGKEGMEALRSLGAGGQGLMRRVEIGTRAFGEKMRGAAMDALMENITQLGGESKDDVVESLRSISSSALDDLAQDDPNRAKLIRAAQKGDQGALDKLLSLSAPSSRETRYGGRMGDIDRQIAKVDEMITATADGGDTGALQAESTKLFADSVKTFSETVKDLRGTGDAVVLAKANPLWQSIVGDS